MTETTKRILSALATLDDGRALNLPFDAELYGTLRVSPGDPVDVRESSKLPGEAGLPAFDWLASPAAPSSGRAAVISAFDDLLEAAARRYLEPLADRREES